MNDMLLEVVRKKYGPHSTLGAFHIDGESECYTLEDKVRDGPKIPGETAIPDGKYEVKLRTFGGFHGRYAARFGTMHKGMLWLQNVPGFTDILIHCGNDHGDTRGCLLLGRVPYEHQGEFTIGQSEAAYREAYPKIARALVAGARVWVEITNEEVAA